MVSGKAATHAAATRWASAEESGRAKKRRRRARRRRARRNPPGGTRGGETTRHARRPRGAEVEGRAPRRLRGDEIRSGVRLGGLRARNGAWGTRRGVGGGRVPILAGSGRWRGGIWAWGAPGRGWRIWSPRGGDRRSRSRRAWSRSCARSPLSRDAPPRATRWVLLYSAVEEAVERHGATRAPGSRRRAAPRVVDAREI